MCDVLGDVKLRYSSGCLSITNFVCTFTYRNISCEIQISQSINSLISVADLYYRCGTDWKWVACGAGSRQSSSHFTWYSATYLSPAGWSFVSWCCWLIFLFGRSTRHSIARSLSILSTRTGVVSTHTCGLLITLFHKCFHCHSFWTLNRIIISRVKSTVSLLLCVNFFQNILYEKLSKLAGIWLSYWKSNTIKIIIIIIILNIKY